MKLKKGFVMRDVCGEHVLVGEGTETVNFNRLVKFNDVAAFLWQKASEMDDFTAETLAEASERGYDIGQAFNVRKERLRLAKAQFPELYVQQAP